MLIGTKRLIKPGLNESLTSRGRHPPRGEAGTYPLPLVDVEAVVLQLLLQDVGDGDADVHLDRGLVLTLLLHLRLLLFHPLTPKQGHTLVVGRAPKRVLIETINKVYK